MDADHPAPQPQPQPAQARRRRPRPDLRIPRMRPQLLSPSALGQAYEAATTDVTTAGWNPQLRSADGDNFPALQILRARARDLARNGTGAGVIRKLVDHIIGHRGLVAQSRLDPELFGGDEETAREAERQIEKALKRWARSVDVASEHDWPSYQRLACRSMLESGDVGTNITARPGNDLALELIEADRIRTPAEAKITDGIREGVERDAAGVPVAYWVTVTHPGDPYTLRPAGRWKIEHRRVERFNPQTRRPQFLLTFEPLRPEQSRGVPVFSSCAHIFDHKAEGLKAALYVARTAAMLAFKVTREGGLADAADEAEEGTNGELIQDVDYGMTYHLSAGEDISAIDLNRPGPELEVFTHACDAEIGASVGMPVELVANDFSKTTWHAARQSSLELQRTVKSYQRLLIARLVEPIDRMVIENAVLRGDIPAVPPALYFTAPDDFLVLTYQVPVRGLVDPGAEIQASTKAIDSGLSTLADECGAHGRDWQDVIDQKAREAGYMRTKGFVPTNSGAAVLLMPEWAAGTAPASQPPAAGGDVADPEDDQNTDAPPDAGDDEDEEQETPTDAE